MISKEGRLIYKNEGHMAETINRTRPAYDALVARLSELGTEVSRDRVLETDTIAPYRFIRKGRVEFVFPPQPDAEQKIDEGGPISGTLGQLVTERTVYSYDESLVEGHLAVDYDDANNWSTMSVVDIRGESSVPVEVSTVLDEAFAVYEPVESSQ